MRYASDVNLQATTPIFSVTAHSDAIAMFMKAWICRRGEKASYSKNAKITT